MFTAVNSGMKKKNQECYCNSPSPLFLFSCCVMTADRIKDLIPEGAVDARTRIVLANAAYFKGTWHSKFNPENTSLELFYSSDKDFTFVNMTNNI